MDMRDRMVVQVNGGDPTGPAARGGDCGLSASWRGNGPPRRRRVAGLRGWSATLGLRHCPDSYGRLQSRIFRNGRKPDGATPRGGRRPLGCKLLSRVMNPGALTARRLTYAREEAPANSVPAAAVIQRVQTLFGITGHKAHVGCPVSVE
jgi:hypothetical protein